MLSVCSREYGDEDSAVSSGEHGNVDNCVVEW